MIGPDDPDYRETAPPPPGAWRLTFAYRGEEVELVSRQRVAMRPPPPDEETETEAEGFRVEVRDAADRIVYRQRLHSPIAYEREVFSPDPAEPIRHVPVSQPTGAFQVIVPDLPAGHDLVLRGSAEPPAGRERVALGKAKELARVRLVEEPPGGKAGRGGKKP